MRKSIGTLDYRSDHYWVVDMPGQDDYELQAGDSMEVLIETHWLSTRIGSYSDSWCIAPTKILPAGSLPWSYFLAKAFCPSSQTSKELAFFSWKSSFG